MLGSTLTVDPHVGGAFCRAPLIGGLACVQALVLPCDPIDVEGAVLSRDQDACGEGVRRGWGGGSVSEVELRHAGRAGQ